MPIVGLILGLVLALWISVFTLFNDSYLLQPLMTGNLMPTSVYGPAVLLVLLTGGGLWRKLGQRQIVGRRDVVVMIVLATAACAWPGTNFLRTFVGSTGNVANLAKVNDHWRSSGAMSHVPDGLLLGDGREMPNVTDTLVAGVEPTTFTTMVDGEEKIEQRQVLSVGNVPWAAWWPVLRTWGGLVLLLGLASVCLGVIVHPQWSRFEKLPYPLVRLIEELTKPKQATDNLLPAANSGGDIGGGRPAILTNRLFWLGLGGVAAIHGVNGLDAWLGSGGGTFLPLKYNFGPLRELLPNAARAHGSTEQFMPQIFFSVVAFTFFIRGDVSFSVGVSSLVWVALGAVFIANGEPLGNNPIETDGGTLLRAGAYLGFAAMLLYLGRRYYGQIAASALWLRKRDPEQRSGVWAARGLAICLAGMVWMLARYVGLDWRLGLIVVGLVLVMLLILARLSAETGMFYLEPNWMPLVVLSAILGFEGMGPAAFLGVALFSVVITGAPREPLMGYVVNALHLSGGIRRGGGRGGDTGAGVRGHACAGPHLWPEPARRLGEPRPPRPAVQRPGPTPRRGRRCGETRQHDRLGQRGPLRRRTAGRGGDRLVVGRGGVGGGLCARSVAPRLVADPPGVVSRVGWSFLIGWAIRQAVIRLGGVKAFQATLPLAVGAIAGELLAALGWQTCGVVYFFVTGQTPSAFLILPN